MDRSIIIVIFISCIPFLITAYLIGEYHKLTYHHQKVEAKWQPLDSLLIKRLELIKKFIKDNLKDNSNNLLKTINSQIKELKTTTTINTKISSNNNILIINDELNKLITQNQVPPENYTYQQFNKELQNIEHKIKYAYPFYNKVVKEYNQTISKFPNNILAKILKYKKTKELNYIPIAKESKEKLS